MIKGFVMSVLLGAAVAVSFGGRAWAAGTEGLTGQETLTAAEAGQETGDTSGGDAVGTGIGRLLRPEPEVRPERMLSEPGPGTQPERMPLRPGQETGPDRMPLRPGLDRVPMRTGQRGRRIPSPQARCW